MSTGQTITIALLTTNGNTPYYQTALQVDGSAVTPKWQGGTAPSSGNANSVDVYTVSLTKTGSSTYLALASVATFK